MIDTIHRWRIQAQALREHADELEAKARKQRAKADEYERIADNLSGAVQQTTGGGQHGSRTAQP